MKLGFMVSLLGFCLLLGCGGGGGGETTTTTAPTTTLASTTTTSAGTTSTTTTDTSSTTTTSTVTTTSTSSTTTSTIVLNDISGHTYFYNMTDTVKGGVLVIMTGEATGFVTADAVTGSYALTDLSNGTYYLMTIKTGWDVSQEAVTLNASNATVNFSLSPASWEVVNLTNNITLESVLSFEAGQGTPAPLEGKVLAVGVAANGTGSILKSENAGAAGSWSSLTSPTVEGLVGVQSWGPYGAGIIDRSGGTFITSDLADPFTFFLQITNVPILDASLDAATTFEVVKSDKRLSHTDNAIDWSGITPAGMLVNKVYFFNDSNSMYVVGPGGLAKKSTNLGLSWNTLGIFNGAAVTAELTSIVMRSNHGLVVSADGSIWATSDNGATWTLELSGLPYPLKGTGMITSALAGSFVCGEHGLIMKRR